VQLYKSAASIVSDLQFCMSSETSLILPGGRLPDRRPERTRYTTKRAGPASDRSLGSCSVRPGGESPLSSTGSTRSRRSCSGRHVPTSSSCSGRRLADLLLQPQHRPVRSGRSRLAAASAAATLTSSRNSCSGYCAADLQQLRPSCFQPPTPVAAPLQLKTAASKLPATAKVAHRSFKGAKIYWCLKT
jgi:hypothetical protein